MSLGQGPMAMHNHGNNKYTIGMGEFTAVLNGVEFRTRHNDYALRMQGPDGEPEFIDFPDVPPSVLKQKDVAGQIEEMREYFRAFIQQDESIRKYKPYFRANLCYLEGAWTESKAAIEESFDSDRHFLDANTWFELTEKIRFNAYTGTKEATENLAYLPTMVVDLINGTVPKLAQWNYRIQCQPLKEDVALDRFEVVDDINIRMYSKQSMEDYAMSRRPR